MSQDPRAEALRREARRWIGGAVILALLIVIVGLIALPEVDLLALRYAVW